MKSTNDIVGMKIGRWTVLEEVKKYNGKRNTYCRCVCDCELGTEKMVAKFSLINGVSRSCGCLQKELTSNRRRESVIGKTYGRLTVKEMIWNYGDTCCLCECECGKSGLIVKKGNLTTGCVKSCGCFQKEFPNRRGPSMVGEKFGLLTVVEMLYSYEDIDRTANTYCKCVCDCGNEHIALRMNLIKHKVLSCGCWHKSHGELLVESILEENNILYEPQYKFYDCRNILPLPFDFYLEDYNTCIEYQGRQHFEPIEFFGGEVEFKKRQKNDAIKKCYCEDKGINLICLSYTLSDDEVKDIIVNIKNP